MAVGVIAKSLTTATPGSSVINLLSAEGDGGTLVAAVAGKKIRVVQLAMTVESAGTVTFKSGTDDLAGDFDFVAAGNLSLVLPYSPAGWFQTETGALLNITLTTATGYALMLGYVLVDQRGHTA